MSPASAALNGNRLYLYLPNWHANIMRYDDLSSSFKLWYLELTSLRERYFTLLSFGSMTLSVGSYVLVFLVFDLVMLGLGITLLSNLPWALAQNCCTIPLSHQPPEAL